MNDAVRILREIASALACAHERGIVHRDIKPDNVLLSGGSAMVTDFGVAKALSASSNAEHGGVTSVGIALGTPAYMAPEQASADPAIDHRADIYALGVLAYEMLTGQPPFAGRTPQSRLAAHVTEAPETISKRRASVPPALATLVMRCLEKRAADRPQSAGEIVHALDSITTPSGGMQPTSTASAHTQVISHGGGRRLLVWGSAVGLLLLLSAGVWLARRGKSGAVTTVKSVAVLPFETGGDTSNAYFADGMTDQLNTALTGIPGVNLIGARSSAMALRGKRVRDAGAQLHVGAVVEGTVRRAGSQLRVTAALGRRSAPGGGAWGYAAAER